jgi:hypothetical protein
VRIQEGRFEVRRGTVGIDRERKVRNRMHQITCILNSVISFLNANSGAILAITTLVYAIITGRMLYETKRMRESQTEPHVFINVQPVERVRFIKNIVIQNIGPGPAYDLKFKIEPDIVLRTGHNLSEINMMKLGHKYLAPNQRLECLVPHSIEEAKKKEKTLYAMTVTYRNKGKKHYEETFVLDFTEYSGMLYTDADPYKGIIEKLDAIHRDINKVIAGGVTSKIRVVAYTKDEHDEELRKYLEDEDVIPPLREPRDK